MSIRKKLAPFTSVYRPDEFDRKPLPDDIFNSEGAILAYRGYTLPRERLVNSFVYVDDVYKSGEIPDGPADAAPMTTETPIQKALKEKEEERTRPGFELTEDYLEDTAKQIEEYLTDLDFEPIPKIKTALRSNIHSVKEIFQKKIINNMIYLVSPEQREDHRADSGLPQPHT